jgi:hypothetical protein
MQIVCETLSWKTLHKNRACGVAESEGPEFKPYHCKDNSMQRFWVLCICTGNPAPTVLYQLK